MLYTCDGKKVPDREQACEHASSIVFGNLKCFTLNETKEELVHK